MISEQRTQHGIAHRPVSPKNPKIKMEMLLQESGFITRGRRADCVHCVGNSHFTVSFTDEHAYCHRCHWKANAFTLARQLGVLSAQSSAAAAFRAEQLARRRFRREIEAFEKWRNSMYWNVANEYRQFGQAAERAKNSLADNQEDETAWVTLGNFRHRESKLSAALDYLSFERASPWLECDACPAEVFKTFKAWRNNVTA